MSRANENLQRLAVIAGLKRDAESQALAKVNAEIDSMQRQIVRLRANLQHRSRDLELDPSRLSGADVHWVRRTEKQVQALQARKMKALSEREILLHAARMAVGRAQVVEALASNAKPPGRDWD